MNQLTIPVACPHGELYVSIDRTLCTLHTTPTWVCCHTHGCAWEEPDNSPEACERRLREMKENE